MHVNSFKPHTGTKTSVLFLQKWNDDPKAGALCPKVENYPIFFATSEHSGKDNSGEYVFVKDEAGEEVLDLFNHQIVDQDLYDFRNVLNQQLAKVKKRDKDNQTLIDYYEQEYVRILKYLPQRKTIAEAFTEFAKRHELSFWEDED